MRGEDDVALDVGRRRPVRDVPDRTGRCGAVDDDGLGAALAGNDKLACVYPRPDHFCPWQAQDAVGAGMAVAR